MDTRRSRLSRVTACLAALCVAVLPMTQAYAATYQYAVHYPGLKGPGVSSGTGNGEIDTGTDPGNGSGGSGGTGTGDPGGNGGNGDNGNGDIGASPTAPALTINPTALLFGTLAAGQAAQRSATVTNVGTAAASGLTVATNSGEFSVAGNDCPSQLAVGASCTVTVTFASEGPGVHTATLAATSVGASAAAGLAATVEGDANADGPRLRFSPSSLSFGSQSVGSSTMLAATLSNDGNQAATLTGIGMSTGGAYFNQSNDCGTSLEPGAQCTVTVAYTPTTARSHGGQVYVAQSTGANVGLDVSGLGQAVVLSTNPSSVVFGSKAATGATYSGTVDIRNNGNLAASGLSVSVSGAGFSFTNGNCSSSLAPGAICSVTIQFTPTANSPASYSGTLSVGSTASASPVQVSLSGTGVAAALAATPTSLDFGAVAVGASAVPRTVTLTNSGSGPATLTGISVVSGAASFSQSNNCGSALAAGASCTLSVAYTPSAVGAQSGTVAIVASGVAPLAVSLTGQGSQAVLSLNTTSVDFGRVNGSTATQQVVLTNTGNVSAQGLTVGVDGAQFSIASSSCLTTLAVGQSCSVTVQFTTPTDDFAAKGGHLNFSASGAASVNATLTGSTQPATLSVSPTSLDLGSANVGKTTAVKTLTVTNQSSTRDALVTGLGVVNGASDFGQSNDCGSRIAAGQSCTVNVTLTPTSGGARQGSLAVISAAGTVTASLTGTGTVPDAGMDPSAGDQTNNGDGSYTYNLFLGSAQVGSSAPVRTITLSNTGTGPLAVLGVSVTAGGSEFSQSNGCGASLPVGGSCAVSLMFTPQGDGTRNGQVVVVTENKTFILNLTGTGLKGNVSFSVSNLSFSTQQSSTTSAAKLVTVTNNGTGTLTIGTVNTDNLEFAATNGCAPALPVNGTCTISVTFTPSTAGPRSGTLILSSDGNGPQTLALSGTGAFPSASLTTPSFPDTVIGSSATATATLSNTGAGPVTMTVPSAASVSGSGFSFSSTTCTGSLAVGASCTVSVTFTPSARGAQTGTLNVTTNAGTKSATLSGNGLQPGSVSITALDFGTRDGGSVNTLTQTLSNPGDVGVSVTAVTATGTGITVAAGGATPCAVGSTFSLAAGASCTVSTTWTVSAAGPLTGAAVQATYGSGTVASGAITGTGLQIFMQATGGTVTTVGNYKVHTFTTAGTFTITRAPSVGGIEVLVVGGGGGGAGGGANVGTGGGGAGGFVTSTQNITTTGDVTVTVGAGGAGGAYNNLGNQGSNSSITGTPVATVSALGGGRGGNNSGTAGTGGSGGGTACSQGSSGATSVPGSGTAGQGNNGSNGTSGRYGYTSCTGGGGGGAGSAASGMSGGAGKSATINGGTYAAGGAGGTGGSGNGASAGANTGNGGGGGNGTNSVGGNGGSGIVVIKYQFQ